MFFFCIITLRSAVVQWFLVLVMLMMVVSRDYIPVETTVVVGGDVHFCTVGKRVFRVETDTTLIVNEIVDARRDATR